MRIHLAPGRLALLLAGLMFTVVGCGGEDESLVGDGGSAQLDPAPEFDSVAAEARASGGDSAVPPIPVPKK